MNPSQKPTTASLWLRWERICEKKPNNHEKRLISASESLPRVARGTELSGCRFLQFRIGKLPAIRRYVRGITVGVSVVVYKQSFRTTSFDSGGRNTDKDSVSTCIFAQNCTLRWESFFKSASTGRAAMLGKYLISVVDVHSDGFGLARNDNRSSGSMIAIARHSDEMRKP